MHPERQVLRWSIPGWVFMFTLLLFHFLTLLCQGKTISEIIEIISFQNTVGIIAAIVIAAGIPLGFIIYQLYYAHPNVYPFHIISRDRGYEIFKDLPRLAESFSRETGSSITNTKHEMGASIDETNRETQYNTDFSVMWHTERFFLFPDKFYILKKEYRNKTIKNIIKGGYNVIGH